MNIFEMIEMAKQSEYGSTWFSEKGPIHISKEGTLTPIKLRDIPTYQPERSKREDFYQNLAKEYIDGREYWEIGSSDKISIKCFASWLDRRCGTLNTMET